MNAPVTPPTAETATPWPERIHARVEPKHGGVQLDLEPGFVVRLYDRQAKDPDAPIFDSQWKHGQQGVFGDEAKAEEFRDRILAATIAMHQSVEAERARRGPIAAHLQVEHLAKRDAERAKASAATKRAKEAQDACDRLSREADQPEITIECNPSGRGWKVLASPALVDGTLGADPRLLERSPKRKRRGKATDEEDAANDAQDPADPEAAPKASKSRNRRGKGKSAEAPAPEDLPPVQDAQGQELRVGSEVELPGLKPPVRGKLAEIGQYDTKAGRWELVVEADGDILRPWADECMRIEPEPQSASGWPDGPEAA